MTTNQTPKGIKPPPEIQRAVLALIEEVGENAAAERLVISRQTMARIAGGMSVNRSTVGAVRNALGIKATP